MMCKWSALHYDVQVVIIMLHYDLQVVSIMLHYDVQAVSITLHYDVQVVSIMLHYDVQAVSITLHYDVQVVSIMLHYDAQVDSSRLLRQGGLQPLWLRSPDPPTAPLGWSTWPPSTSCSSSRKWRPLKVSRHFGYGAVR